MPDRSPSHRLTRHDLQLAVIAIPLALAGLVAAVSSVPAAYAFGAGAVPASGGLGYALFYRPPAADGE